MGFELPTGQAQRTVTQADRYGMGKSREQESWGRRITQSRDEPEETPNPSALNSSDPESFSQWKDAEIGKAGETMWESFDGHCPSGTCGVKRGRLHHSRVRLL